jgi:hypothetical protein
MLAPAALKSSSVSLLSGGFRFAWTLLSSSWATRDAASDGLEIVPPSRELVVAVVSDEVVVVVPELAA